MELIELNEWAIDQNSVDANLKLAEKYVSLNQLSAALTHYQKCLDLLASNEDRVDIIYHSLCMISWIYIQEGNRWHSVYRYAKLAKSQCPDRPEAYQILTEIKINELRFKNIPCQFDWMDAYENSRIGMMFNKVNPGNKTLYFNPDKLKALYLLSSVKICRVDEAKELLSLGEFNLNDKSIYNIVVNVYSELNLWDPYTSYHVDNNKLKLEFKHFDLIRYTTSPTIFDLFALTVLDGKLGGSYIEMGYLDPTLYNDSYLFESLKWSGLSINKDINKVIEFNKTRSNKSTNDSKLLSNLYDIEDDIDVVIATKEYESELTELIKHKKPLVLSYRHLSDPSKLRIRSLLSEDYVLISKDLVIDYNMPIDDWYIRKDAIEEDWMNKIKELFKNSDGIPVHILLTNK